ncbi:MAG TPA: AAA family ATPase [Candidatus Binataceae bacterium]|nr:AAA family ATPase [Candidatus Binataceae bacterium]
MWWLWPHLRRLWAAAGTVSAGLAVNYLYGWLGNQPAPTLSRLSDYLWRYRYWSLSALLAFAVASVFAEQQFRKHAARAPRPLRTQRSPIRTLLSRLKLAARMRVSNAQAQSAAPSMVGRATEMARLNDWFEQARKGTRRVILVSGEPGIGKTALTRAFADSLASYRPIRIGRGQCVDQYGAGEPYLPILEALTRLCREPGGNKLVEILYRVAPAWLAQMPSLISSEDRVRLQGLAQATTQQRMLREMAEALDVIAAETPLVLCLEDLHWSDPSTLDLIATVARRSEPARLMILGTYRPVEMLTGKHPLREMKEELELHQHAIELRLPLLSEADVAAFLAERFSDGREKIAPVVYARTEGNPLFIVNVIEYLVDQGLLAEADNIEAPHNIRQMIERNLQRLSPDEQRILEAASVAGAESSAAAIAAALQQPATEIEACCTALARREQFIATQGIKTWPDGTVAANIRFHHSLYREALYDRVPPGHRIELHERIAARTEQAYGKQTAEISAELANHYRQANRPDKAVRFFALAAERAVERRAFRETEQHYRDALAMLLTQPESIERNGRELKLQLALGSVLMATKGWAAPETESAHRRADELAETGTTLEQRFTVLVGLFAICYVGGKLAAARERIKRTWDFVNQHPEPAFILETTHHEWTVALCAGELQIAQSQIERGLELYETQLRSVPIPLYTAHHPAVCGYGEGAHVLWLRGHPDAARRHANHAVSLAKDLGDVVSLVWALGAAAHLYQFMRDVQSALEMAEAAIIKAEEIGFLHILRNARIVKAWALAEPGQADAAVVLINEDNVALSAAGAGVWLTHSLATLAEACATAGRIDQGLKAIAEALHLLQQSGECFWEAEIYRVRGELLLKQSESNRDEAQASFERAIQIARAQTAKSLELRATTSLTRLLRDTNRCRETRAMLVDIYGWFTEGFDTADLKDAKALLDELET